MERATEKIIAAVDAAPTLFKVAGRLKREISTGASFPAELAEKRQQFDEISATLHRITAVIWAVPDQSISRMLKLRAITGMPWSKIRSQDGGDSRELCAAYIDVHLSEILEDARSIHSIAERLRRSPRKED